MSTRYFAAWMLVLASGAVWGASIDGASWSISPDGPKEKGIHVLDGGDGASMATAKDEVRCLANKPESTPPAMFLYFAIIDELKTKVDSPLYLTVEYYDGAPGGLLTLEYDSAGEGGQEVLYRQSDDQWGGWYSGANVWKKAVFLLEKPGLKKRQNNGGDFRLGGAVLYLRELRITTKKPSTPPDDALGLGKMRRLVKIGKGGELIVGGFDPARKGDEKRQVRSLRGAMSGFKALGVTSHEGYVRWNLCEPEQGKYDWSVYDPFVELYKKNGLKWVPFLIVGSAYSLPDWYYKKEGSQGYVCLEHGEQSDVQSLWNPVLREHVGRFIKAFCDHYRDSGVIESILLGVTGNFGEAIYPASGNDWTSDIHGQYHTHAGIWAGDPLAQESFRKWVGAKYPDLAVLNTAWKAQIADLSAVKPFLRKDATNDRAWLDFCDWYIGSMTEWAKFWLQETRKSFPKGEIYLCTGGNAPAEHGADFGEQCKIAAEIGGGVRITNEGSDYESNFALTRWVASAGRQYGAYYSFEPAGEVNAKGVIARIYGAAASGARGLHYYYPNLFTGEEAFMNFARAGKQFQQCKPITEVAIYYPETFLKLKETKFLSTLQPLRDCFDFDYMSDQQILDGGLSRAKCLILLEGNMAEAKVWEKITAWVRAGGLLSYPEGMGRLRTVEGDESVHNTLFGETADLGAGRVLTFAGQGDNAAYRGFLSRRLPEAKELSKATRAMISADGQEDNLFVTLVAPHRLLWLNYTKEPVKKGRKLLPPYSIVKQRV